MKILTLDQVGANRVLINQDLEFVTQQAAYLVGFNSSGVNYLRKVNTQGELYSLAVVDMSEKFSFVICEIGLGRNTPYSIGNNQRVKINGLVLSELFYLPVCQMLINWINKEISLDNGRLTKSCIPTFPIKIYKNGNIHNGYKRIFPAPPSRAIHLSPLDQDLVDFFSKVQLFCNTRFNMRLRAFIVHADLLSKYCSIKRAIENIQADDSMGVLQNKEWLRYSIIMYSKCHSTLLKSLGKILERNFFADVAAGIYGNNTDNLKQRLIAEQDKLLMLSGGLQIVYTDFKKRKNANLNKHTFKVFADHVPVSELKNTLRNLREYAKEQAEIKFNGEPPPF